jgi:hypothetical protein
MSDRERWIVYPLLFLTLGIALRNQFLPTRRFGAVDLKAGEITAQKILCNDLVVYQKGECKQFQFGDALGKHIIVSGLAECVQLKAGEAACQAMLVVNKEGKPVVMAGAEKNSQAGVIQTTNPNGMPLVQIRGTDSGGLVTAVRNDGKVIVEMGHEGDNFGVFALFPQVGQTLPLTSPLRFGTTTATPKPSQATPPIVTPQQGNPTGGGKTP